MVREGVGVRVRVHRVRPALVQHGQDVLLAELLGGGGGRGRLGGQQQHAELVHRLLLFGRGGAQVVVGALALGGYKLYNFLIP